MNSTPNTVIRPRWYSRTTTQAVPNAIARPAQPATSVARSRSPISAHTAARSARPPSSGRPGSTLNTATMRLLAASWKTIWPTTVRSGSATDSALAAPPSTSETAGPASETSASTRGLGASRSISVQPPSSSSVMPRTPMPYRRAVSACPSSCSRTEPSRQTTKPKPNA
jgi:hypothetical protein